MNLNRIVRTPDQPLIAQFLQPFQRFAAQEASGGIVLLACAVLALLWANSPWSATYESLWGTSLRIGVSSFELNDPLSFWINDALMALFFFLVGLEIKHALLVGELASPRRAALPVIAAVGGMLVPAALFTALNFGAEGSRGWGIPMSTDIAFSLGVLALLGRRVPISLKVFLTAFAIVDDIGGVLVIALFYTDEIAWIGLAVGLGSLAMLVIVNWIGVRHPLVYALLGTVVWMAFLKSGVHAAVAGVIVAATVPTRMRIDGNEFLARGRGSLTEFEQAGEMGESFETKLDQQAAIQDLEASCKDAQSPLERIEQNLHPWVAFGVLPLFALANAGVPLGGNLVGAITHPVLLGVVVGLVIGKQVGITLFAWLAVKSGLAALPNGVNWRQIYGVAWIGGIGFTISLFISHLAFGTSHLTDEAKIGILVASIISGLGGWVLLRWLSPTS